MSVLAEILRRARACTLCAEHLPAGPRPLFQAGPQARVLVIGQAPGRVAHESGIPWNDASGRRLREWLGVTPADFYDPRRLALLPMGLCFPGKGASGDLAPRLECAPLWHPQIRPHLHSLALTIFVGSYAFAAALGSEFRTLSEAVAAARALLPHRIVLPHPSPRNGIWLAQNPWFQRDVLPALRERVREVFQDPTRAS